MFPSGWFGDWHPTPRKQFFFGLSGEYEVKVSDGESRVFGPGSVVLVEDVAGKGHVTRAVGSEGVLTAIVQLED
jgi:quercetin dioxygenase-like cupin family protein